MSASPFRELALSQSLSTLSMISNNKQPPPALLGHTEAFSELRLLEMVKETQELFGSAQVPCCR